MTHELTTSDKAGLPPFETKRAVLTMSDPMGQAEDLKKEQTLPSRTTLLYCRFVASTSGRLLAVKKVGDDKESCSIS